MAKIYDLEKEKLKAKEKAEECHPPIMCLTSEDGIFLRVYPAMKKGPDGKWHIANPEAVKAMLGYNREETDKGEEPEGD